jgi:hypothetical protein
METSAIKAIRTSDIGNNFTQKELRKKVEALITNQSPVATLPGSNIIIILRDEI